MRLRFSIRDLLWLTAVVGIVVATYQLFADHQSTSIHSPLSNNCYLIFTLNIAVLTTATVAARFGNPGVRQFTLGYAVFGWAFLVCVLHGSFGYSDTDYLRWLLAKYSMLGVVVGAICGIASLLLLKPFEPPAVK